MKVEMKEGMVKRFFPFHGQTRKNVDMEEFHVKNPGDIPMPCRLGVERPYGTTWIKVTEPHTAGWRCTMVKDAADATVFDEIKQVLHFLEYMALQRTPWCWFAEAA